MAASPVIALRQCPTLPILPQLAGRKIFFRHPGYPDVGVSNVILILYAFDSSAGGLHYYTAWLACALVAGNAWTGYLTETRQSNRLQFGNDNLLTRDAYYFWVPQDSGVQGNDPWQYPIVPNFANWNFPHHHLPPSWRPPHVDTTEEPAFTIPAPSGLTSYILQRDEVCQITGDRDHLEHAHLCPKEEVQWFQTNSMTAYNTNLALTGTYLLDDVANAVALRPDIHKEFDQAGYVFVQKQEKWTVHFLRPTYNLGRAYHNIPVDLKSQVSPEFLLARFAWAIFPLVRLFLHGGLRRALYLCASQDDDDAWVVETLNSQEIQKRLDPEKKPRNASPAKRSAPDSEPTEQTDRDFKRSERRRCSSGSTSEPTSTHEEGTSRLVRRARSPTPSLVIHAANHDLDGVPHSESISDVLSETRIKWLKAQRPTNPELLCCDYNRAEEKISLGLPGKPEFGGAYLCLECLGAEYRDDEDLPPIGEGSEASREL
ncbi:MAG: hypothetical protein Q9196_001846 [Gyalolechia fulgens]